ncbi:MAG: sugar ABC transporter ATP-binding protein [Christensenellales bacterium]
MQLVEIAKALSMDADIIIMDEPTSALTEKEVDSLFEVIRQLKQEGKAIIYISHRLEEILRIGDRITVYRDGKYIDTIPCEGTTVDDMSSMMVGRKLEEQYPRIELEPGDTLLEVKNLVQKDRLHDISFYARRGEIVGFYGLMGAGRTELMRAVFGADPFQSGEILIEGKPVRIKNCESAKKAKIALLPEDRKNQGLILDFIIKENISLVNYKKIMNWFGIANKNELSNAQQYADALNIKTPSLYQQVKLLSGGNQQKTVVAKWLNADSDIVIFDEPTRGIDVGAKVEIYKIMNELKKKGKAVLMVSSELTEALGISDRLYVMYEGRINACIDDLKGVTEDDVIKYATGTNSMFEGER